MGTQKNRHSFEHSKHMFKLMGKEINAILGAQNILIWTCTLNVKLVLFEQPLIPPQMIILSKTTLLQT